MAHLEVHTGPRCSRCDDASPTPTCTRCVRRGTQGLTRARGVYAYAGPMRHLVMQGKHHANASVWAWAAQKMLLDAQAKTLLCAAGALVPIPLAPHRRLVRGYNQSGCLAVALARQVQKPVAHLLRRTHADTPQSRLPASMRTQNVAHTFLALGPVSPTFDGPLVLIDDVMTTGATMVAAAIALRAAGAAHVNGVALARHLRPRGTYDADGL